MSIYLEFLRLGWDNIVILFVCNHLYKIYYAFIKESRYIIVIKKEKNIIYNKDEIYVYSNVSRKSA